MDRTTATLVDYALSFEDAMITPAAREAALRRLVDSIACAIAGYRTRPAQVAISVARSMRSDQMATVFGAGLQVAHPYAVFANTIMVRSWDWNDGMLAPGSGHPSDMIAALIAAGEVTGASGRDLLRSMILAYELLGGLGRVASITEKGFDKGLFLGVATALTTGLMHGLNRDQLANAVAISIVPAAPLRVSRRGELSMWKGAATASAALHASNAVMFAKAGMTGPSEPFDGREGVKAIVSGPFELVLPTYDDGRFVVQMSHQKRYPAESHAQALLELILRILQWTSVEEIESIEVEAYRVLVRAIGSDPSVWDPKTRETADHSLPYLLAVALVDKKITTESFTPRRIADPALRPLMAKVRIRENTTFSENYRPPGLELAGSPRVRITIRKNTGDEFFEEVTFPRGHSQNPMSRVEIDQKFEEAARGAMSEAQCDGVRDAWWKIESADRIADPVALLSTFTEAVGCG